MESLPDQLKALWTAGAEHTVPEEQLWREQQRLLDTYRAVWAEALRLEGHADLKESLLSEIGEFTRSDNLEQVEQQCRNAVSAVKDEWYLKGTEAADRTAVEAFYDQTKAYVFDLMW